MQLGLIALSFVENRKLIVSSQASSELVFWFRYLLLLINPSHRRIDCGLLADSTLRVGTSLSFSPSLCPRSSHLLPASSSPAAISRSASRLLYDFSTTLSRPFTTSYDSLRPHLLPFFPPSPTSAHFPQHVPLPPPHLLPLIPPLYRLPSISRSIPDSNSLHCSSIEGIGEETIYSRRISTLFPAREPFVHWSVSY